MTKDISPNKISDQERRRADHIKQNLQKQGLGEDDAEKRAVEMAVAEQQSGQGGGKHSGGGAAKGGS